MQKTLAQRFNQVVETHYQPLFRFAASLCGSPEIALQLTQSTFRIARRRADQDAAPPDVRQWLFTLLFLLFLRTQAVEAKAGCVCTNGQA